MIKVKLDALSCEITILLPTWTMAIYRGELLLFIIMSKRKEPEYLDKTVNATKNSCKITNSLTLKNIKLNKTYQVEWTGEEKTWNHKLCLNF